jgi:hypothetical protein
MSLENRQGVGAWPGKQAVTTFEQAFRSGDPDRDNFVARVFGIFNEMPVRLWGSDSRARFTDRGRPVIQKVGVTAKYTLDFTLEDHQGRRFVAEQKCWTAWNGGSLLALEKAEQVRQTTRIDGSSAEAMKAFLDFAQNPSSYSVTTSVGGAFNPAGAILVWPIVTDPGRSACVTEFGFAEVLSIEDVVKELLSWPSQAWLDYTQRRHRGCERLFEFLEGK